VSSPPFDPPDPAPAELGEIIRRALRLYRSSPLLFVCIALIVAIPLGVLDLGTNISFGQSGGGGAALGVSVGLEALVTILVTPMSWAAATVAAIDAYAGREPDLGRSLEPVGEHFWPMAGALLVATAGILIGAPLVIPAVFLLVLWVFVSQATVVEGRSVRAALARSAELVRGGWWRVFATVLVAQAAATVFLRLLVAPVAGLSSRLANTPQSVITGLWEIAVLAVVEPLVMTTVAVLYLDRRVRLEGRWPETEGALAE